MRLTVAIQPDDYTDPRFPKRQDCSSAIWQSLLEEMGFATRLIDVFSPNIIAQIQGCDAFMWRWGHSDGMYRVAKRLLPILEHQLKLLVYPNSRTCWHYDDKVAQAYLLEAAGIPVPATYIFHREADALEWVRTAGFPIVMKLSSGAGSSNVALISEPVQAIRLIHSSFKRWQVSIPSKGLRMERFLDSARLILRGKTRLDMYSMEPQRNTVLFQEFVPNNKFDTRVTVIGNRAFVFRRWNAVSDFRASGSGLIDWDPAAVDEKCVRLAYRTCHAIGAQSCAVDVLVNETGLPLVGEISYTFASWAVYECPGHWQFHTADFHSPMAWVSGRIRPEEALVEDFSCALHLRNRV